MKREIVTYRSREEQAAALAEQVAAELTEAIARKGRAVLCVPGGSTPAAFFHRLSKKPVPWSSVTVVLNDERWVPPDHARSNERLLRETLLRGEASAARFVPLYSEAATPEDGLTRVVIALRREVLPIDVLVLGMGEDMHTASLFPGADRLSEALDPHCPASVLPMRADAAGEPRITLTLPALLTADTVHLLIAGEDKRTALETAMQPGPEMEAPVRAILAHLPLTVHYAD